MIIWHYSTILLELNVSVYSDYKELKDQSVTPVFYIHFEYEVTK